MMIWYCYECGEDLHVTGRIRHALDGCPAEKADD